MQHETLIGITALDLAARAIDVDEICALFYVESGRYTTLCCATDLTRVRT